jgi:fatty-acyl-CoA synthase
VEAHFATLWESIADVQPDAVAVSIGSHERSWADWDERAARLAASFGAAGLGPGSKVGLYLFNGIEYCEVQFGAFKARGVPININYRYLDDELHYLLENSDAEVLVFHGSLGDRVERVMARCPQVKLWLQVDDEGPLVPGAQWYEDVVGAHAPAPRITRSEDDLYMLYTGGTTGMPKGVMYNMGGMTDSFVRTTFPTLGLTPPSDLAEAAGLIAGATAEGKRNVSIPACPMMHGTGGWVGTMMPHCAGAEVACLEQRSFDAHELWQTAMRRKATQLVIVGDAFARPMLTALDEAKRRGEAYDTSSIRLIISSGVMWSAEVKQALIEYGDYLLFDAMGSSEGTMGNQISGKGLPPSTAKFAMAETTKVFNEAGEIVKPGSGERGMVAAGGNVPIGYYKDETKSAATFRVIDGVRYSFPGDWATVEADGTITLLGRGSQCINTAGEKVFPEEVEEAVKLHPDVIDCLVVGVPDEKFGERVTAVASVSPGASVGEDEIRDFVRERLSAYKVPKQVLTVAHVQRAPNGKADYVWARETVETANAG